MIYTEDYDGPYLKKFAIPFYHTKIEGWDAKKIKLDEIYDVNKHHMVESDQVTDYDTNRQYHFLLEGIPL